MASRAATATPISATVTRYRTQGAVVVDALPRSRATVPVSLCIVAPAVSPHCQPRGPQYTAAYRGRLNASARHVARRAL